MVPLPSRYHPLSRARVLVALPTREFLFLVVVAVVVVGECCHETWQRALGRIALLLAAAILLAERPFFPLRKCTMRVRSKSA